MGDGGTILNHLRSSGSLDVRVVSPPFAVLVFFSSVFNPFVALAVGRLVSLTLCVVVCDAV